MIKFSELSEEEQIARLRKLARRALDAWSLADADIELIKYRENAVFRITYHNGFKGVLRVHRPAYRTNEHIRSEAAWMQALAQAGVFTPTPYPTAAGDSLTVVHVEDVPEPRQCDLLDWVDGQPLGTLEQGVNLDAGSLREVYMTIGEIAARLHAHAVTWRRPRDFVRPAWDVDSLIGNHPAWGRFWELDVLSPDQRSTLLRARDRARESLAELGPARLLIHGDLIPDNILVDSTEVRVIDFDDCGWSWCAFELVTSVFPLLVSGGFETGLASYLAGYRRIRPFPEEELAFLPSLVMARALSYLGWPVGRPEIHSQAQLIPFVAAIATDLAQRYLSGELRIDIETAK
jgi:Ser/Thr protein kinase RdoA (MazF antagonist)